MSFAHLINPVTVRIGAARKVKFDAVERYDYERKRAHAEANRERYRERWNAWRLANPEKAREKQKRHYAKPSAKAKRAAYMRAWRAKRAA